jgi:hypothetical protein
MPKVTIEQFVRIAEGKMNEVVKRGREITRDNGEYAAELVRDVVETSGTIKTGKRGRIETGKMLASVDSDYKHLPGGAEATWGFVHDAPDYTTYQEFGTQWIEPMNAIDDAAAEVAVDFKNDIDRMMKEVWD